MQLIVKGKTHRAQLKVFDITHYGNPEWRTVTFYVSVLPLNADPSRTYSTGRHVYGGPDIDEALKELKKALGVATVILPGKWLDYVQLWAEGKIYDGANREEWEEYGRKLTEETVRQAREEMQRIMEGFSR